MSNVPLLVGVLGKTQGQSFSIPPQGLRIGRQAGNEVLVDDTGVSRQHARLIFHNGALWVQDMGSRNGVFVNDARVQAHRQLSVGDRVRVGNCVFEVSLEAPGPDQSVSVIAPRPPPRKGIRVLPLVVVAVVVIALVALVALAGRGRVKVADRVEGEDEVASLLASTMDGLAEGGGDAQDEGAQVATAPVDASLSSLLGGGEQAAVPQPAYGSGSVVEADWPDPPPGMSSRELVEKAHGLYNAGRLHDALVAYHQAQMLDEACEICARRIDRLNTEITEKISEYFDAGLRYYDDMQFQQAVASWEMVLLLAPNPDSRSHQQAKEYLEKAQTQMSRQY